MSDAEMATDPFLPEVGWSWLTDALDHHGAHYKAAAGTVTQTLGTVSRNTDWWCTWRNAKKATVEVKKYTDPTTITSGFDLKVGAGDPVELRMFMRLNGQVLTETWAYQMHV